MKVAVKLRSTAKKACACARCIAAKTIVEGENFDIMANTFLIQTSIGFKL